MTLRDVLEAIDLTVCCAGTSMDGEITGGYSGDLLSDVIANSKAGQVWITMQAHVNIVAVAVLKEHSAIILVNGRHPDETTLRVAIDEKITILSTELSAYEMAGTLYNMGIGHALPC
jgi:hypothetical protein